MYVPDHYKNTDQNELLDFIRHNSFGILITFDGSKPVATHIPMMIEKKNERIFLVSHISKENKQTETLVEGGAALAIFHGPQSYVSSSWYGHENVSTWNYIAVHVNGKITLLNELELLESLINLTDHFEATTEKPKYFDKIDPKVVRDNITGIVGFKLSVDDMQASYKLSQNRNDADYKNIISHLEKNKDEGARQVAEEMRRRRKV